MHPSQYSSDYSFRQPVQTFSVFVNNIPPNIQWRWLKQIFQHHGTVMNVFISQKRSRSGKKFGFVRFSSQDEAKNAVERLNRAWLLDYRLNVDYARFNASSAYWKRVESQKEMPIPDFIFTGAIPKNTSSSPYAEDFKTDNNQQVSIGEQVSRGGKKQSATDLDSIEIEASIQDKDWLEFAVVGSVKPPLEINEIQQCMYREGFSPFSITSMGGSWFLFQFVRKDEMLKMLAEGNERIEKWFNWVKPRSENLICDESLVWIKIHNLPLHAWNRKILKQIEDHWSRFIIEDECSCKRKRLDFAKILIVKKKNSLVKDSIALKINGLKFVVNFVVEDISECWWNYLSSIQAGCSSSSSDAEETPVRKTTPTEGIEPVDDYELPVVEANVRINQNNNELPLENEESEVFEKRCQNTYDEQFGILNREKELGGSFETISAYEILKNEATVAKKKIVTSP